MQVICLHHQASLDHKSKIIFGLYFGSVPVCTCSLIVTDEGYKCRNSVHCMAMWYIYIWACSVMQTVYLGVTFLCTWDFVKKCQARQSAAFIYERNFFLLLPAAGEQRYVYLRWFFLFQILRKCSISYDGIVRQAMMQ